MTKERNIQILDALHEIARKYILWPDENRDNQGKKTTINVICRKARVFTAIKTQKDGK